MEFLRDVVRIDFPGEYRYAIHFDGDGVGILILVQAFKIARDMVRSSDRNSKAYLSANGIGLAVEEQMISRHDDVAAVEDPGCTGAISQYSNVQGIIFIRIPAD